MYERNSDTRPDTARVGNGSTTSERLAGTESVETIADRVDIDRIGAELPEGWSVRPDLVQSGPEPLAETLLFRRSLADPQLTLRPADPSEPGRDIELYERSGARGTKERTMTVDRLPEAIRAAVNRVHQLER